MNTFSVHKVGDRNSVPFNKEDYSRFKYGSKSVAREFGRELGKDLAVYILDNVPNNVPIVISSSPFTFIPTATFAMKDYVIATMNPILVKKGFKPIIETKVIREIGYTTDYGNMSADERRKMTSGEQFYTDRTMIKDNFCIFLDDIKITGVHQELMEKMIKELGLYEIWVGGLFAYYGELIDPKSDATIEGHLNCYSVKNLLDVDKIIKNDEFVFNTRVVKYILNAPHIECVNFLEYQKTSFIETLYYLCIGNSYHLEERFTMNFQYLEYLINKK